ncbi:hypothetical protein TIFTF001_047222 [Ficus carica]|uniref:Uncharacterized protein n=1 Tax=Ficus carica TaxID=3494 RepID=A0AA88CLE3_FICCA|nr:hypothetical protein TIFTF001_047222 [Ficus carica]
MVNQANESSQGSNGVIGNGPHPVPWEFKINMTRNEVDVHFITMPERVLDETLFLTNLSQVNVQRLHINQMVCVTLRSLDRFEFYDMNLKPLLGTRAPWCSFHGSILSLTNLLESNSFRIFGSKAVQD